MLDDDELVFHQNIRPDGCELVSSRPSRPLRFRSSPAPGLHSQLAPAHATARRSLDINPNRTPAPFPSAGQSLHGSYGGGGYSQFARTPHAWLDVHRLDGSDVHRIPLRIAKHEPASLVLCTSAAGSASSVALPSFDVCAVVRVRGVDQCPHLDVDLSNHDLRVANHNNHHDPDPNRSNSPHFHGGCAGLARLGREQHQHHHQQQDGLLMLDEVDAMLADAPVQEPASSFSKFSASGGQVNGVGVGVGGALDFSALTIVLPLPSLSPHRPHN